MNDPFDQLIKEAKEQKEERKRNDKLENEEKKIPLKYDVDRNAEAVVLLILKGKCLRCKAEPTWTNPKLMLRAGTILSVPKKWIHQYDWLPRETYVREQSIDACEKCFDEGSLYESLAFRLNGKGEKL